MIFLNMEISLTRGANFVITYKTLPHAHIRILSIKNTKTWKGLIPGATEIVPLFAYYIKNLLLSKDFFEKNILIENTAPFISK